MPIGRFDAAHLEVASGLKKRPSAGCRPGAWGCRYRPSKHGAVDGGMPVAAVGGCRKHVHDARIGVGVVAIVERQADTERGQPFLVGDNRIRRHQLAGMLVEPLVRPARKLVRQLRAQAVVFAQEEGMQRYQQEGFSLPPVHRPRQTNAAQRKGIAEGAAGSMAPSSPVMVLKGGKLPADTFSRPPAKVRSQAPLLIAAVYSGSIDISRNGIEVHPGYPLRFPFPDRRQSGASE